MNEKTSIPTDKRNETEVDNKAVKTKNSDFSLNSVSLVDRILFLQRTIGNQGVKRLMRAGTLQAGIKIEHPDNEPVHVMQQGNMTLNRSPSDDRHTKIVDTANSRNVILIPQIHGASIDEYYGKTRGTKTFAPAAQKISRVRMHSGAVAGQSARNMNAFPGISSMLLSSLLLQRFAGPEIPLTAGQVAAFRSLAHEVAILIRSGALVAEETAAISTAVAEAETAIVATESIITTVVTATTAAEGATVATAALAIDDVTIIGAADDVALPFTIIAAVVGFGVGFGVGYIYRNEIAAAAQKVGRAVNIMRRILANHDVAPNPNTQQQTKTETQTQTKEREKRRKNCFEYNPGAVPCDEPVYDGDDIRDEIVAEWLMQNGYDFSDLVNCTQFGSPIGAGEIEDCGKAPAIRYHCQIKGTGNVVSIFACLCCDIEGNSRFQWSRPHWSINQSRRSQ